jgi:hypothetical protein
MLPKKEPDMVPLAAEILTEEVSKDGRTAVRRSLRLGVQAQTTGQVAMALIINISETGLLIETAVPLAVGDVIQLDLPEASASTVRVVWKVKLRAGCEFVGGFPRSALSAALLASSSDETTRRSVSTAGLRGAYDEAPEQASISAVMIVLCSVTFLAFMVFLAAVVPLL